MCGSTLRICWCGCHKCVSVFVSLYCCCTCVLCCSTWLWHSSAQQMWRASGDDTAILVIYQCKHTTNTYSTWCPVLAVTITDQFMWCAVMLYSVDGCVTLYYTASIPSTSCSMWSVHISCICVQVKVLKCLTSVTRRWWSSCNYSRWCACCLLWFDYLVVILRLYCLGVI